MTNRLAGATSPYLQQHAGNPVDWYEWSDEAFAEAKRLDRPILLSIGYAACHWCHVMARESFEDERTAAFMNEHFVCIKVDREERPDVDAVYMSATQAMTGQGGWPMTCVLSPAGEPFFAGTYFPAEPRQGLPAFTQLLQALSQGWTDKRSDVLRVGADVVAHLGRPSGPGDGTLDTAACDEAVTTLATQYDAEAGGFAGSPKFPPAMVLEFLLRAHVRTGSADTLAMVTSTCGAMARGGIHDQLAGGFARYSVDRYWRVPHFEKMLYDNALLLRLYLHLWRQTRDPLARRVPAGTAQFLIDELQTPEGGFASALDADTDGEEGRFYVWSRSQLADALGAGDAGWAAGLLGVTEDGTFEQGSSTLQMPVDPDDTARWQRVRETLLSARSQRTRPHRDDKVVAGWNGLTITALAEAGILLKRPDLATAAVRAATLVAQLHTVDGQLRRTSRDGVVSRHRGVLDDYGCVAEAYVAVLGITGDPIWLARARSLMDDVIDGFADPAGGYFDTPGDGERLVLRPKDVSDNASPSGTSSAAGAFVALGAVTGEQRYSDAAKRALDSSAALATQAPRFAGNSLAVAEAQLAGPLEIAVVGARGRRDELHRVALGTTSPGAVVIASDGANEDIGLLAGRDQIDGLPTAYVCQHFSCRRPVTDPGELAESV